MVHETHGFVKKFKNLWQAGRNASLTNKSSAGKAQVELSVELGEATPVAAHGSHQKMHNLSRNGPARQRRREKRAAVLRNTISLKLNKFIRWEQLKITIQLKEHI